jgi:hypothetical protein
MMAAQKLVRWSSKKLYDDGGAKNGKVIEQKM